MTKAQLIAITVLAMTASHAFAEHPDRNRQGRDIQQRTHLSIGGVRHDQAAPQYIGHRYDSRRHHQHPYGPTHRKPFYHGHRHSHMTHHRGYKGHPAYRYGYYKGRHHASHDRYCRHRHHHYSRSGVRIHLNL